MKRTTKRFLLASAALFCLLVVLGFFIPQYQSGSAQKARILQLAAQADRIVLDPNIFPNRPQLKSTTIVPGHSAVVDLLARIEFEPAFVHSHCMCIGEVAFRFQQNEREVLALTLHHGQSLRILDSKWARNANMELTPASRAAIADWLRLHGYNAPPATASAPND